MPGMFVSANVVLKKKNTLAISKKSLVDDDHIFLIKDDKAILKNVKLGLMDDMYVEIISVLFVRDEIITSGQHKLKNDTLVKRK